MGINDVSDAFDGWLEPLTADRRDGSHVEGIWVPGTPVVISFNAVVQNTNPQDLLVVEEGLRTEESIKVHTTTKLIAQNKALKQTGDEINYDGAKWLVYSVAHRAIGNYHKAIAIEQ